MSESARKIAPEQKTSAEDDRAKLEEAKRQLSDELKGLRRRSKSIRKDDRIYNR